MFKGFDFGMQERKCSNRRHADELQDTQNKTVKFIRSITPINSSSYIFDKNLP